MTLSQQAPLVERPHSAKCLGERFQDAFLVAWGQERGVAYADLPAEVQAKWNRAAVAFVCTLSDAPSEAAARITELEGDLKAAFREISKLAREAGEATGRLAMSEAAGILDGWRERAERAEARCRALENASPAEPSGWRPIERLKSWQGGMETEGPNAGEFTASMVFANHADCVSFIQFCASFPLPPTSEGGGA